MTSPAPGPLAEEAARLVEALSDWARDHIGAHQAAADPGRADAAPDDLRAGGSERSDQRGEGPSSSAGTARRSAGSRRGSPVDAAFPADDLPADGEAADPWWASSRAGAWGSGVAGSGGAAADGGAAGVGAARLLGGLSIGGGAECTACPVCQLLAVLRQVKPETFAHLLEASAALTAAVRSLVEPRPGPATPGVQRIDLDDER